MEFPLKSCDSFGDYQEGAETDVEHIAMPLAVFGMNNVMDPTTVRRRGVFINRTQEVICIWSRIRNRVVGRSGSGH